MRTARVALALIAAFASVQGHAQTSAAEPAFDVVSIRPSAPETGPARTAATPEQRAATVRHMLVDRLHLVAHIEPRELPSYDLLLDRKDGRLGPGLVSSTLDCDAISAARREGIAPLPTFDPDNPTHARSPARSIASRARRRYAFSYKC